MLGISSHDFVNKYFRNRTKRKNQNVIGVTTGSTGSGKTYSQLGIAEQWYAEEFNKPFPVDNVCFSLVSLMKRIKTLDSERKLRQGSLFILEEAGANFGNLDFQQRLSKMFSYVLQSFRSMNLILLMNVPVITMINKSARQLVHFHMTTKSIDRREKKVIIKCLMHQLNQGSGKSYWKHPRVLFNKKSITLKEFSFKSPSKELRELYENEKSKFVTDLIEGFIQEDKDVKEQKKTKKEKRKKIKTKDIVRQLMGEGKKQKEIVKMTGKSQSAISQMMSKIEEEN